MTKEDAFKQAQLRADRFGHRVAVFQQPKFWRGEEPSEAFHCTRDRDDLPEEWIVVGYCEPAPGK